MKARFNLKYTIVNDAVRMRKVYVWWLKICEKYKNFVDENTREL